MAVLIPVYWREYGPANFLWFCDIALILTVPALWLEHRLLAGTQALSIVLLDGAWIVDFACGLITGHRPLGMADYMFKTEIPLAVRCLSLFHLWMPVLLVWMVRRLGYDRRALAGQCGLAWIVLPACYGLTSPAADINWVFGFGKSVQTLLPPQLYLVLLMAAYPILVYVPTHAVFVRLFGARPHPHAQR